MKKKLITATFASALLLSGASGTVFAASGDTATTTGSITFTKVDNPVNPVDPTDPTKPVDPTDPDNPGTGQTGDLTLDVAPELPFGEHAVGAKTIFETLNAHPYLQVSDRRGDDATGWFVTTSITDFASGSDTLDGTTLDFASATVKAANVVDGPVGTGSAPTSIDVVGLSSASTATNIFTAGKGQGLGTWLSVYDPANIKLTVPDASQKAGTYSATLTWTINAAPIA